MKYCVKFYDKCDKRWIIIKKNLSKEDADKFWNTQTHNGTQYTKKTDQGCYKVFKQDDNLKITKV